MTNREILEYLDYESLVVFDNPDYDDAIIGVSHDDRVIYDYDKMIEHLVNKEGMSIEDAADFISYNTIRALSYMGEDVPIVMFGIEDYKEE
jgi:hypothetical protein